MSLCACIQTIHSQIFLNWHMNISIFLVVTTPCVLYLIEQQDINLWECNKCPLRRPIYTAHYFSNSPYFMPSPEHLSLAKCIFCFFFCFFLLLLFSFFPPSPCPFYKQRYPMERERLSSAVLIWMKESHNTAVLLEVPSGWEDCVVAVNITLMSVLYST